MAPFVRVVEQRIERNAANPLWSLLEEGWSDLVRKAEDIVAAHQAGRMTLRHEVQAAHEIRKLAADAEPRSILVTGMAMFLFRDAKPRRFRSDTAFMTQLVRRLRGLGEVNVGTWFDHQTGRVKRVYGELPPRATAVFGAWIVPLVGPAGLKLADLERKDREGQAERGTLLRQAMEALS